MPTGYTAQIEDRRITNAKDFLLLCTRAFGVAIDIKDEPLSTPTPMEFEPDEYFKINLQRKQQLTNTIVTRARVQKLLHKMIDDGILIEDWSAKEIGIIAKNLGRAIYGDCVKEEPEIVSEIGDGFGKFAASTAMRVAREILREREQI